MKVLFPFIGDSLGGSHKSAIDYAVELRKKKIHTKILILKKNSILEKYLKSKKLKFDFLNLPIIDLDKRIFKKIILILIGYFKAKKYLKKNKISIVHTNDVKNHFCWSIWSLFNTQHYWHQRTIWPNSFQFYFFILFSKKILCNSVYLKKKINFNYLKKKALYIPNIIYENKINKKQKKNKKIIIGTFSNIQIIKRPDILGKLADLIYKKKLNIEIRCYGRDKDKLLNKYIKPTYLNTFFKIYGQKLNAIKYMKKCDIVVATSEDDTLGRSILEAMSLGIPAFATNAGGHKEIISNNKNGVLFDLNDTKNLLNKILLIKKNIRFKNKLIKNGLIFIKKFNNEIVTNKLIKIYEKN